MLKSFIQKFFVVVVLTTSLFSPAFAAEDYQIVPPRHYTSKVEI